MVEKPSQTGYASAMIRLRAPRVAITVPVAAHWQEFMGVVLDRASKTWGGAGFMLVPHLDGEVDTVMLRLARAYDPDHVVTTTANLSHLVSFAPDLVAVPGENGPLSADAVRARFPDENFQLSSFDEAAARATARACNPFFEVHDLDDGADGPMLSVDRLGNGDVRDLVSIEPEWPRLGEADLSRSGAASAALFLASETGLPFGKSSFGRSETHLDVSEVQAIHVQALTAVSTHAREAIPRWSSGEYWRPSMRGLVALTMFGARRAAWLVVGSTATDFALFHNLSRVHGNAAWIASEWLEDTGIYHDLARAVALEMYLVGRGGTINLVSASLDVEDAAPRVAGLVSMGDPQQDWLVPRPLDYITKATVESSLLGLENDWDRDLPLPAMTSPNGDITLVHRLPPLIPEMTATLAEGPVDWVIDVDTAESSLPLGRGLRAADLQVSDGPILERLRNSRSGIAIMSSSHGLVLAGAPARQRVARPRLLVPGLDGWARAVAANRGADFRTSDAGFVASVAAGLWGSRNAMADDLHTDRRVFHEFLTDTDKYSVRYPDGEGWVLRMQGYPTFMALARATESLDAAAIGTLRSRVDSMLDKRILRRGFIVRCPECTQQQFQVPEDETLRVRCDRCRDEFGLAHANFHSQEREPIWYYDLHPIIRRLLRECGDIPLLASRYLAQTQRGLTSLPEFHLTTKHAEFEIDLLATTRDFVAVGEAKKKPRLQPSEIKRKITGLVEAARTFQVDRVILASGTESAWSDALLERLTTSLAARPWPTGLAPSIQTIVGLRTDTPADTVTLT